MKAIFLKFCPNCKEDISDKRLSLGSLCSKCLSFPYSLFNVNKVLFELQKKERLKEYQKLARFFGEYQKIQKYYQKIFGSSPTTLQETWIKRVLLKKSFAIIAPTGIGKTAFGLVLAIYFAFSKKRVYLIFPTSLLVQQAEAKLKKISKKLNLEIPWLAYHSALKKKEKKQILNQIKEGNFSILITTDRFLALHSQALKHRFDFIFVDDVDSFLKTAKNIEVIVNLLGGDKKAFSIVLKKIKGGELTSKERKYLEKVQKNLGILVFSSATAKARRTKKVRIFHELFGFEIGYKPEFIRNIKEFFLKTSHIKEEVYRCIKDFGKGGLVFVPSSFGKDFCQELKAFLKQKGIECEYYEKPDPSIIKQFQEGKLQTLIGIASYKSPLARGLDLPETVRYAIFTGVPRQEISLSLDTFNPSRLLTLANAILLVLKDKQKRIELEKVLLKLRKIVPLSKENIELIEESVKNHKELEDSFLNFAKEVILKTKQVLNLILTPKFLEIIEQREDLRLKKNKKGFKLVVADAIGYLQASGRTSRMFIGGISKGLSVIIVDDKKAFFGLKKKLEYYLEEFEMKEFQREEIKGILKEIDKHRNLIKLAQKGKLSPKTHSFIKTSLIIVESPTKAKTIARFFGKSAKRTINGISIFEISSGFQILNLVASIGHIVDLVENKGFDGVAVISENKEYKFIPLYDSIKKCLNCGAQFVEFEKCPKCKSKEFTDKKQIIEALQKIALEVNQILIATDPDAEGEKIAFDLYNLLKPFNPNISRIEFHEITKKAIKSALENPREINQNLVNAQIVRRIEDRWVGFELSKTLQKRFKNPTLSAGRVQTPVLGWIIKRTSLAREKINLLLVKTIIENQSFYFSFRDVPENLQEKKELFIETKTKEEINYPLPPYTTDTLLKDASKKFKYSTQKTMQILQNLFEIGLITYHRTDSTHVSSLGVNIAKKWLKDHKKDYLLKPRSYGKEGTHECIRPTRPIDSQELVQLLYAGILKFPLKLTKDHLKIYDLIFKRFLASQCKEAKVTKQKIIAKLDGYVSKQENIVEIKEVGFYEIIPIKTQIRILSGKYSIKEAKLFKISKEKPFSQGDVISLMKEKSIGRPSTYSKIMQTLLERGYVVEKNNYLFSTKKGFAVFNFLNSKYSEYVSEEFTQKLEKDMDLIEAGKLDYIEVLEKLFYKVKKINIS